MLSSLTVLLVCQLAGEVIAVATGLPVPGPVLGMALLFAGLLIRGGLPDSLASAADGLLVNLAVLFVPAGVGVMVHLPLLAEDGAALAVALVASTLITIVVTAAVMRAMTRLRGAGDGTDRA